MAYQDIDAQITNNIKQQQRLIDRAEQAANFLTNFIEENITLVSVRAGWHKGSQLGFKGRALLDFASDMGAVTQSMYNREGKPAILRTGFLTNLFPFQTFTVQTFNTIRETVPFVRVKDRAGAFQTVAADSSQGQAVLANRMKMWLAFIGVMFIINMVVDKGTGRKPWIIGSFIPFFSILRGVADPANPWNFVLPAQYLGGFLDAMTSFFKFGDMSKFRKWVLRYHAIGGTQFNRIIDGSIALVQGEHQDVKGGKLFEVNQDEWFKAMLFGPYATEGGKEFIDKMFGETIWEEMLGIELPKVVNIDDEIDIAVDSLGIVNEDGGVYDFGNVVSRLRAIRTSVGENKFNKSDNPLVVEFLKAEAISEELEALMDGLPSDERIALRDSWRKDNPEKDAYLALFAFSGRIQSMEAYDLVRLWAGQLDITMADLDTFLPPENVAPSYFGYIDLTETVSGSSSEARFFRLINPDFDTWGQEAYGWQPIDEKLKETFPTNAVQTLIDQYDSLRKPDGSADTALRTQFRIAFPVYDAWAVATGKFTKTKTDEAANLSKKDYLEWYRLGLDKEDRPTGPSGTRTSAPSIEGGVGGGRLGLPSTPEDIERRRGVLEDRFGESQRFVAERLTSEIPDILDSLSPEDKVQVEQALSIAENALKGEFPNEDLRVELITFLRSAVDRYLADTSLTTGERDAIASAISGAHDFLQDMPFMSQDVNLFMRSKEPVETQP